MMKKPRSVPRLVQPRIQHRVSMVPALCLGFALLLVGVGCAAKQKVTFRVGPSPVSIFIDGKELNPKKEPVAKLRRDREHVVMLKKPGYEDFKVIIKSLPRKSGAELSPDWVEVDLVPIVEEGGTVGIESED